MSTPDDSNQGASMRAGTRDRDATAEQLQEAYAEGRITSQEHDERLSKCYEAVTMADLAVLTADLPKVSQPVRPSPAAQPVAPATQPANPAQDSRGWGEANNGKTLAAMWGGWAVLSLFMVFIWAFSGMGYFWPVWVIVPTAFGAAMTTVTRKTKGSGN